MVQRCHTDRTSIPHAYQNSRNLISPRYGSDIAGARRTPVIVLSGGIKGCSGKTTVATNLAVMRATAGRDVLLVDADDQESASDFTMLRNEVCDGGAGYTSIKLTGKAVRTELLRLAPKYDDIIIDTGGRDTS